MNTIEILAELYDRDPKELTFEALKTGTLKLRLPQPRSYYIKHHEPNTKRSWVSFQPWQFDVNLIPDVSARYSNPMEALDHAIMLANIIKERKLIKGHSLQEVLRAHMRRDLPYCVSSDYAPGNPMYLVNRNYNPVGSNLGQENSIWKNYPQLQCTGWDKILEKISWRFIPRQREDSMARGYFFNDSCAPWHSPRDLESYIEILTLFKDKIIKEQQ